MTTGYRYALQQWVSDGVRVNYNFSFDGGYLDPTHVKAYREPWNGSSVTGEAVALPVTFVVDNGADGATATVRVGSPSTTPQPTGYRITVYRDTPKDVPLVDFQNGAVLTGGNLNEITRQAIFSIAEVADQFEDLDANVGAGILDLQARVAAAEAIADDAAADADTALTTANSAANTAGAALTAANGAVVTANATSAALAAASADILAATNAANAATAALDGIQDEVDAAVVQAQGAAEMANDAASAALAIADVADAANVNATNAVNTANAIDAKAQTALDNAAAAVSTANAASTTADNAATAASGAQATADAINANANIPRINVAKTWTAAQTMDGFAWRMRGWGGAADTGVIYFGDAAENSYIYKNGTRWELKNGSVGTYTLNGASGSIYTSGNLDVSVYALKAGSSFTGSCGFNQGASFGLGISFGGVIAGTATDLSKHISLHTSGYGFNIVSGKMQAISNNAVKGEWTATGYVVTGACNASGGFQSTSSRKVKTALKPVRNALKTLDSMEFVTGKYRQDFHKYKGRKYFAIAEAAPAELVVKDIGEYKGEKVDGFDYDGLAVLNSAAIRELLAIVQEQAREIAELKEML